MEEMKEHPPMMQGLVQADHTAIPGGMNMGMMNAFMGMKFCPECGTKAYPGDKFCRECGARLTK